MPFTLDHITMRHPVVTGLIVAFKVCTYVPFCSFLVGAVISFSNRLKCPIVSVGVWTTGKDRLVKIG